MDDGIVVGQIFSDGGTRQTAFALSNRHPKVQKSPLFRSSKHLGTILQFPVAQRTWSVSSAPFALLRLAKNLRQEFRERLPIVRFPSRRQDFRFAFRKACMVKYDFGPG